MKFKLALAQIDPVLGNLTRNINKHITFAERAKEAGADLVMFPELSLTGYSIKDMNWELAVNLSRDVQVLQPLLDLSKSISILAGAVEESSSFAIYNSAFLFEDGAVRSVHRKTYPPTYGMFEEIRYFNSGDSVRAFDSKHGRFGVLICEDLWHISLPYILANDGANIILTLVASPTRVGGNERELQTARVNFENHKSYARLLTTYLAFCNRTGFEDGINFWGGSSLVGPDGEVEVSAKLFDEDLIIGTVDDAEVRRARRFSRHFLDERTELVAAELSRIHSKSS
ncbi:MAG: acyltransferase [Ignavibacteriae bacterium]|nr:acyltransferase [Ignavibacteriota bacterium]